MTTPNHTRDEVIAIVADALRLSRSQVTVDNPPWGAPRNSDGTLIGLYDGFGHALTVNYDTLNKLATALGTTNISLGIHTGTDESPGYSTWTPGDPANGGAVWLTVKWE